MEIKTPKEMLQKILDDFETGNFMGCNKMIIIGVEADDNKFNVTSASLDMCIGDMLFAFEVVKKEKLDAAKKGKEK